VEKCGRLLEGTNRRKDGNDQVINVQIITRTNI
jgi:hypothetical protein